LEGRQSLGALSALRPAARLGTPASFLSDEMPIGLEKGIVMTMLRNAGSLKNDKKFNMREIVIDTETTGLDPLDGHRIVEIGAVEMNNRSPTGNTFQSYVCPERAMPADAVAVHGLTTEFLVDEPLFGAVADEFLAFVSDAPLVAHNAGFDIAFLNAELKRAAKPPIATERVIDTLVLARRKHAGGLTLDDLCSRYAVDRSHRTQHGALLDAELLAAVYVELTTTRQASLQLEPIATAKVMQLPIAKRRAQPLPPRVTANDRNAHQTFVRTVGSTAIWRDYFEGWVNAA
jgi:DNA polymerase III subunit epsilon